MTHFDSVPAQSVSKVVVDTNNPHIFTVLSILALCRSIVDAFQVSIEAFEGFQATEFAQNQSSPIRQLLSFLHHLFADDNKNVYFRIVRILNS